MYRNFRHDKQGERKRSNTQLDFQKTDTLPLLGNTLPACISVRNVNLGERKRSTTQVDNTLSGSVPLSVNTLPACASELICRWRHPV